MVSEVTRMRYLISGITSQGDSALNYRDYSKLSPTWSLTVPLISTLHVLSQCRSVRYVGSCPPTLTVYYACYRKNLLQGDLLAAELKSPKVWNLRFGRKSILGGVKYRMKFCASLSH